jgi:hypothetical protein
VRGRSRINVARPHPAHNSGCSTTEIGTLKAAGPAMVEGSGTAERPTIWAIAWDQGAGALIKAMADRCRTKAG